MSLVGAVDRSVLRCRPAGLKLDLVPHDVVARQRCQNLEREFSTASKAMLRQCGSKCSQGANAAERPLLLTALRFTVYDWSYFAPDLTLFDLTKARLLPHWVRQDLIGARLDDPWHECFWRRPSELNNIVPDRPALHYPVPRSASRSTSCTVAMCPASCWARLLTYSRLLTAARTVWRSLFGLISNNFATAKVGTKTKGDRSV